MNRRQKEVQQKFLDNEKVVLKQLESNYQDALDEINSKIEILLARQDADMQHVIYQVEYQKALKTQVQAILEQLQNNEFETLSEYLTGAYEDGFIGTMYDLQGQGIPLVFPIDQEQIVAAIQHETPLSSSLYVELGHDIKDLSKKISGEISRGIATGAMYTEMARNIASYARIPKNRAMTIARTEAHRIQCVATADAQWKAKKKGADVVKQWDSSLDGKTRDTHRILDGQIRELDEPFEVEGKKAMYPGGFGRPEEDINCRCALLQRARWVLEADIPVTKWSEDAPIIIDEDGTTQFIDISDAKNYKQFKDRYQERVRQGAQKINNIDLAEYRVENFYKNNYSVDERIELTKALASISPKLKEAVKDTTFSVGRMGSCAYDKTKNILYVAEGATKEQIIHEIGHALENNLLDKAKVDAVKKSLVEGIKANDIVIKTFYDASNNPQDIYIIKSDKFISDYQGRIYINDITEAFDEDGNIDTDLLLEVVPEAVREYYENGMNLLQHKELYDLIKDMV